MWIVCTNPAASMPDTDVVERALRQAELVIVQDAYHPTETTRFADVLLPAAQWPEKDGVMTSSERRLTYLPKLVEPPGEALPDAEIFTRFAAVMGWKASFAYGGAADIFDEHAALTRAQPCDCSGVSHARLRAEGPLQWPLPHGLHPGTERLYTDGRFPTPVERALLLFERGASLVLGSGSGSLAGDGRRRVQGPSVSPPAASRHERRLTRVVAANVRHGEEIVAAAKRGDAMLARKPDLADRLA